MSFFFCPIPSQYQNCCVFLPVLPYFVQIQNQQKISSNEQISSQSFKTNQNRQFCIQNQWQSLQRQKLQYFKEKKKKNENQSQVCFLTNGQLSEELSNELSCNEITSKEKQVTNDPCLSFSKQLDKNNVKSLRVIKIKNKELIEEEYKPFQKKKRTELGSKQNQNRNIIPNEVNQIFSYLQKSSKSKSVVNRIFKKYPPPIENFNIKKFYLYQSLLKEKVSNYINQGSLSLVTELYEPRCEIYSEQQQRYYNRVCRILIYHFLQQGSIFNILTSRRMHKDKKRNHLSMRRVLKDKVVQILKH